MTALFQSYRLNNGVELKNRLVVAPMTHFGRPIGLLLSTKREKK